MKLPFSLFFNPHIDFDKIDTSKVFDKPKVVLVVASLNWYTLHFNKFLESIRHTK